MKCLTLLLLVVTSADCLADDEFRSPQAREALAKYDRALRLLDAKYRNDEKRFRDELIATLEAELKAATMAADLDEANRLQAKIKELQALGAREPDEPKSRRRIPRDAATYNGHKYYLSMTEQTWRAARERCEAVGGYLARIETPEEQAFVWRIIKAAKVKTVDGYAFVWIDGSDEHQEGTWQFSDGSPMKYFIWGNSEPNNFDGREHSLGIGIGPGADGKWSDVNGMSRRRYLCEWD